MFWAPLFAIFWARLQAALGVVAAAVTYVDPQVLSPIIPSEISPWFLVINALLTEFLRRRRAEDL
ncbi:MAG: hypothetical protein E5Y67_29530 [Mesorhizobium sp.]|nr:MAG: hypothetical protein E5Y67_29530 [Mesorhizobium sp.]